MIQHCFCVIGMVPLGNTITRFQTCLSGESGVDIQTKSMIIDNALPNGLETSGAINVEEFNAVMLKGKKLVACQSFIQVAQGNGAGFVGQVVGLWRLEGDNGMWVVRTSPLVHRLAANSWGMLEVESTLHDVENVVNVYEAGYTIKGFTVSKTIKGSYYFMKM